jgi:hypothetical protein
MNCPRIDPTRAPTAGACPDAHRAGFLTSHSPFAQQNFFFSVPRRLSGLPASDNQGAQNDYTKN